MEKAYDLEYVLIALERQVDLLTDGEYETVKTILQNDSHGAADLSTHKYWGEIQELWFEIKKLQEGNYYEHPVRGRRGLARITTTGERVMDAVIQTVHPALQVP